MCIIAVTTPFLHLLAFSAPNSVSDSVYNLNEGSVPGFHHYEDEPEARVYLSCYHRVLVAPPPKQRLLSWLVELPRLREFRDGAIVLQLSS